MRSGEGRVAVRRDPGPFRELRLAIESPPSAEDYRRHDTHFVPHGRTLMSFRWLLIAIIAFVAYTYGAKAGHGRYKEIANYFGSFWNDPQVKKARKTAKKNVAKARKVAVKKAEKKFS